MSTSFCYGQLNIFEHISDFKFNCVLLDVIDVYIMYGNMTCIN